MTYDAADLAIIETSLGVIEEPARSLLATLIEMVREHEDEGIAIAILEEKILKVEGECDNFESERDDLQRDLDRGEAAMDVLREEVRHLESRWTELAAEVDRLEDMLSRVDT